MSATEPSQRAGDDALLVTVEEAARRLSIGRSHCYQLLMRGEIASIKLGRSRRIPVTALQRFVRERLDRDGESATAGGAIEDRSTPSKERS